MYAVAVVLGLFAARQLPPSAAPLSPASLPPPAVVKVPVKAEPKPGDIHIRIRHWPSTEAAGDVVHKAVGVLFRAAGCTFAEVAPDGTAWGYNRTCRFLVLSLGDTAVVVGVSREKGEPARLVTLVEDGLKTTAHDAKAAEKLGTRDEQLEASLPGFAYHTEVRPVCPVAAKHFLSVGALALERRGFQVGPPPGPGVVIGGKGAGTAQRHVAVVWGVATPKHHLYAAWVAWAGKAAPLDTPMPLCTSVVRILHD